MIVDTLDVLGMFVQLIHEVTPMISHFEEITSDNLHVHKVSNVGISY